MVPASLGSETRTLQPVPLLGAHVQNPDGSVYGVASRELPISSEAGRLAADLSGGQGGIGGIA